MDKFIYFPKDKIPQLVIITNRFTVDGKEDLQGSTSEKDITDGRFQFYPARRCQPYTPELWQACMRWISKWDLLKAEYEQLMKTGNFSISL